MGTSAGCRAPERNGALSAARRAGQAGGSRMESITGPVSIPTGGMGAARGAYGPFAPPELLRSSARRKT